jgi:putative flippase GtrA
MGPLWANAVSLVITTIGNTAANRRFTFGVTGPERAFRQQLEGGLAFLLGLGLSTGGLALLTAVAPGASRGVELAALVFANGLATLVRFLLMRAWIFHPRRLGRHVHEPFATAPVPAADAADAEENARENAR